MVKPVTQVVTPRPTKPAVVQVTRPIPQVTPQPEKPMHPLEKHFMERMYGQQPTPMKPVGVTPPPRPVVQPMTPTPTYPPMKPIPGATSPGLTPPSAFPTFEHSTAKPVQKPVKAKAPPEPTGMPSLEFTLPIDEETPEPDDVNPSAAQRSSRTQQSAEPAEAMDLGFDINKAEDQLSPEKKKEFEMEAIMDRFKNVVTTQQKMLAYELADAIGVTDHIEEFYEFLSHPDKDGIIIYKNDQVKINKTKIMGALMLGDNSILDRVMTTFRVWLVKALK